MLDLSAIPGPLWSVELFRISRILMIKLVNFSSKFSAPATDRVTQEQLVRLLDLSRTEVQTGVYSGSFQWTSTRPLQSLVTRALH